MTPDWWPDWRGETVVIVASGPSAKDVPLDAASGRARFIVINESWRLAPWADILFGCDYRWWASGGHAGFQGLRVTTNHKAAVEFGIAELGRNRADDRLEARKIGTVGWGGHSGFQALNLAVQLEPRTVLMVGYDATIDHGTHWHPDYEGDTLNPSPHVTKRWRRTTDAAAEQIAKMGIRVINCSEISELRGYPKMPFMEALDRGLRGRRNAQMDCEGLR